MCPELDLRHHPPRVLGAWGVAFANFLPKAPTRSWPQTRSDWRDCCRSLGRQSSGPPHHSMSASSDPGPTALFATRYALLHHRSGAGRKSVLIVHRKGFRNGAFSHAPGPTNEELRAYEHYRSFEHREPLIRSIRINSLVFDVLGRERRKQSGKKYHL